MPATVLGAVFPVFARLQSKSPDKRLGGGLATAKLSCPLPLSLLPLIDSLKTSLALEIKYHQRVSETNRQFEVTYEELCGFAAANLKQRTLSPNRWHLDMYVHGGQVSALTVHTSLTGMIWRWKSCLQLTKLWISRTVHFSSHDQRDAYESCLITKRNTFIPTVYFLPWLYVRISQFYFNSSHKIVLKYLHFCKNIFLQRIFIYNTN